MSKIKLIWGEDSFLTKDDECFNYIHIISGRQGEYTTCGIAFPEEIYSNSQDKVDCPECIKIIKEILKLAKEENISFEELKKE